MQRQTVPCLHFAMLDQHGKGPGYIRNRLLEKVTTPYVGFLDADDWLEPTFAEETLRYTDWGRWPIFTDWLQDGARIRASRKPWCEGTFHLITTVLPTDLLRSVGGFDETLPAMEDTDLYLKIMARGLCGLRVPKPLVHYRKDGGRAFRLHQSQQQLDNLRDEMNRRYGGIKMGCCGNNTDIPDVPAGERGPNDVLAMALWWGNRVEHGRSTGRHYPRTGNHKMVWVDIRDVRAAPHLWQEVPEDVDMSELPEDGDPARGVAALAQALTDRGTLKAPPPVMPAPPPPIEVHPTPDFDKVRTLIRSVESASIAHLEWGVTTGEVTPLPPGVIERFETTLRSMLEQPIFVIPAKTYPSYSDFWELVKLAGQFQMIERDILQGAEHTLQSLLNDPRQTLIFTGPDAIPDCAHARARTIFWQLEYVGDYTEQANYRTVSEVWSSDPTHAKRTGAKYVLLGSHKGLNSQSAKVKPKPEYDVTMLAYMTSRREAIQQRLNGYRFPATYPGHTGDDRHKILRRTRLMLHAHQHDTPAMTPLRYALAAAYRLPLLSERVPEAGPLQDAIMWADFDDLPPRARLFLEGKHYWDHDALYDLLCREHTFGECVEGALKE